MKSKVSDRPTNIGLAAVTGLMVLSTGTGEALAQEQDDKNDAAMEEIVVSGYRGSLANSTAAKKDSVGFSDEIFADDIGKLPSQNLAESLNRIPGVKIGREVTGEGLQIAVRGLGPSFTKIVLNGNNIAIASDGALGAGNRNREVDLGTFPTELFTQLSVSKSASASQMEGGISGYVNLRTARPFDNGKAEAIQFSLEGAYAEINEEVSPKASFLFSKTFDEKWGVLFGLVSKQSQTRVDGYETIGYTDGCFIAENDPVGAPGAFGCVPDSLGRNHMDWNPTATADYVADYGGNVGDAVDLVDAAGVSAALIDSAIFPYLGRGGLVEGDRDTLNTLLSFEFRPSDTLQFAFDIMHTDGNWDFNRVNMMLFARRTRFGAGDAMIPVDMVVDNNQVIREVTLYNSSYFVEARDYEEALDYSSYMPSLSWQIRDDLRLEISASRTESDFQREMPTWLYQTPKGVTHYRLDGDVPSFETSFDVNDPGSWDWYTGGAGRFSIDSRQTETTGLHVDLGLGDDPDSSGVKFGLAYDQADRFMQVFDNSGAHTDALLAAFPNAADMQAFLYPMSAQDFGGTMDGDLGYEGFAQLNYDAIKNAYDYNEIVAGATRGGGDSFGQTVGDIEEEYLAFYFEANAEAQLLDRPLRFNFGLRYVETDQTMASFDSATDSILTSNSNYDEWLPSINAVFNVSDEFKLRFSASRAMTRANPADMFPNSAWTSVGIDTARSGNPNLSPFFADNIDVGGEYYFDELGYVGFTLFNKRITGFTSQQTIDVPFNELDELGLDTSDLGDFRENELALCGGPEFCTTAVTTRINVEGSTDLFGQEFVWVQPLDNLIQGLGFNISATHIEQDSSSPEAEVAGISDWTYNWTGFYENESFQLRLTYYHQDEAIAGGRYNAEYDGNPLPDRFPISLARSQVDLSASYTLPFNIGEGSEIVLSFDAYNMTNEPVGTWFGYEGVPDNIWYPGATYTFGLRGNF